MKRVDEALLQLIRTGIRDEKAEDPRLSAEEWNTLLRKADLHKLLPLVLDQATPLHSLRLAARSAGDGQAASQVLPYKDFRENAVAQACHQAIQENEFLNLILDLRARGLEPLVVKGAICRALYPKPLLRTSVDDDLLIPADRAPAFHGALLELGLICDGSDSDPETAGELSYHRPDSPLYIELHKELFDRESPVFSGWNGYFSGAEDRSVPFQAQDVVLKTMCPTDHLLFLILHAFKHFLFSGFGLRIISDIALFAREYAGEIDFDAVCRACGELRCLPFAAASFRIAEKYLGIQAPAAFSAVEVDEGPLLEDVLEAGIHGQYIDRLHSANITLQTVAADRQGERGKKSGLRASLFPSARQLQGRYPFLKRRPWLLPAAWVRRIGAYALQRREGHQGSPTASLRIGRERVALLETYDIIDPQ